VQVAVAEPVVALRFVGEILARDRSARLHAKRAQHLHGLRGVAGLQVDEQIHVLRESRAD